MNAEAREIFHHLKNLSFNILGRATYDCTFSEMMSPFSHTLAVVHAAHGAELFLKAVIAKEHPLLIFEKIPKPKEDGNLLSVEELVESGITIKYSDLPDLLWASTGFRMSSTQKNDFLSFGKLRNKIVHLGISGNRDVNGEVLKFIFGTIDHLNYTFFGENIIDYACEWDEVVIDGYLLDLLKLYKIDMHPITLKILEEGYRLED